MYNLSKSKILSLRQCEKKLWLEVHHKELATESAAARKNFAIGDQVGAVSRQIYDPTGTGTLIDPFATGFTAAFALTETLLAHRQPIFEAAFSMAGGLVLADVLLPGNANDAWRMIEIKSSTAVKDYHLDDVAIQYYVATKSGLNLESIALGHIDNQWVYHGAGNYQGLITEVDLTAHAQSMHPQVQEWFTAAQAVANLGADFSAAPKVAVGPHCTQPFACPFIDYCCQDLPQAEYPVAWLPRMQSKALKEHIESNNIIEMAEIPDELLNEKQRRVKDCTLSNTVYFAQEAAQRALESYAYPHFFLDFETINLAIPKWPGTRAYQQLPFQFSLHCIASPSAELSHQEFLDLTGDDPSLPFAEALLAAAGESGPIYVYNIAFESTRIKELAARFSDLAEPLLKLNERLVDLWPITKEHYYHPSQQGSWSIKAVLPAISNRLSYAQLDGVHDGAMAMDAYAKAIHPQTPAEEKQALAQELRKYCELDTLAMVEMLQFFLTPVDSPVR